MDSKNDNHYRQKVHFILQGKGGVGKSFIASLLAQQLLKTNKQITCIDVDPVSPTLSAYEALNAKFAPLVDENNRVDFALFDETMMEVIKREVDFVIDVGSSAFKEFVNYLLEADFLSLISDSGKDVYIHIPISGGTDRELTVHGFEALASQLPDSANIVTWLTEHHGPLTTNGKRFEETELYEKWRSRLSAVIHLPLMHSGVFGRDLRLMNEQRLTFVQVRNSEVFDILKKQRLAMLERKIDQLLCNLPFID